MNELSHQKGGGSREKAKGSVSIEMLSCTAIHTLVNCVPFLDSERV